MKNFFLLGLIGTLIFVPISFARETLLPSSSVVIETGEVDNNTLVASPDGEIFIEFSADTHFVHEEGGISFTGEILPPAIIDLGVDSPKLRMEEIVMFELISDTGEPVIFADRFDTMYQRNIITETSLDPDATRSSWVKLIVPIEDPTVGRPELWEFVSEKEGWAYIGGIIGSESPEGIRVFTVVLRRTGAYAVFDASPPPRHYADEFDGSQEQAMADSLWNESGIELPEGMTWEDINNSSLPEGYEFTEDMAGVPGEIPAIPEANINVANRAITTADKVALEARKSQLLSQIIKETEPERIKDIRELLTLIERKIIIADQREQLVDREEQLEIAITKAATADLAEDLTEQLAMVRSQLANLKDVELDRRMVELEDSLNGDTTPTLELAIPTPVFVAPEPEIEIPLDAELPKSGADEVDTPSLAFPIALLAFVIVIIGSMALSVKKKH